MGKYRPDRHLAKLLRMPRCEDCHRKTASCKACEATYRAMWDTELRVTYGLGQNPRSDFELDECCIFNGEGKPESLEVTASKQRDRRDARTLSYGTLPEGWLAWLEYMRTICAAIRPRTDGRRAWDQAMHVAQRWRLHKPQTFPQLGSPEEFRRRWEHNEVSIYFPSLERGIEIVAHYIPPCEEDEPSLEGDRVFGHWEGLHWYADTGS